jgi:hypothetical protein
MIANVHYQTEAGDYEEQDTLYSVNSLEEVFERCQYDEDGYIDAFVDSAIVAGDRIEMDGQMFEVCEGEDGYGFKEVEN